MSFSCGKQGFFVLAQKQNKKPKKNNKNNKNK